MSGRLLTTREAAARLGVSVSTVKRMLASGELAGVKIRSARRFEPAELEALIAREKKTPSPPAPSISEGQLRAFHAKCNDADRRHGLPRGSTKRAALDASPLLLGREVESVADLTAAEASRLLDWLEEELHGRSVWVGASA